MGALYWLLFTVIDIYIWILIISAVVSWLIAFNVINTGNRNVGMALSFLHGITDPVLRPIRKIIPYIGGVDISPVILILLLLFIKRALIYGLI